MEKLELPHYQSSVYLDGFTYRLSFRIHEGQRQVETEVPHNHPQYELHTVLQGEITLEQEGMPPIVMHTGDCCIVPPSVYHIRKIGEGGTRCCTLYVDASRGAPFVMEARHCVRLKCAPILFAYLGTVEQELSNRQNGALSSIQSLLTLVLVTVLREISASGQKQTPKSQTVACQQREETIDNFFASHYGQDVSARDLAEYLEITTRQLARVMQKRYGCTFRQHLLEIRLYHARQRLGSSREPVWKIANDCGFASQGAFATAFRRQVGCTPSQYRTRKDLKS